ncbi:MAG: biopolymer transporter ExbD [Deltaproteobacteria bacterium]|nr:biopolymer transporter ExbD [Deltaproteobacteria bacterium]
MKRRESVGPVDLNMVPVMNLFLAMIPFLLSCAAFFQAAVINASVPALSEGAAPGDADEDKKQLDKVSLTLQITKTGFVLTAQGDQTEEELKKWGGTIAKKGKEYDFEQLAERVKKIKDRYKKSDTIVILPDKDVLYNTIVQVMDATRERTVDPRLDSREVLFSNAVVSSIL